MNMQPIYALASVVFAAIFLVSIIALGNQMACNAALMSSWFACASQFLAQDSRAWMWANGFAYAAFGASLGSLIFFIVGW